MLKAIKCSNLKLGNYLIEVCILEDGQRIVTQEGLENFLAYLESDVQASDEEVTAFAKAIKQ